ncbi:MAG TPA: DUF952 domain-containing protein, partial [Acidimicrobiales bacterium]
ERSGEGDVARDQLERHGFVHCCTREQLVEIATWWFSDAGPLVALEIDVDAAGDVRFERADNAREYPHVYNAIPRAAVAGAHPLTAPDGAVALPPALADPPPSFEVVGRRDGRPVSVRWRAGAFVAGDPDLRRAAAEAIAKAAPVPQFPDVEGPASADTAYEAFCLVATLVDDVVLYAGDGFGLGDS